MQESDNNRPKEFMFGPVKCSSHTISELMQELSSLLLDTTVSPRTINCLNAHIFNLAWSDSSLRSCLNNSRIVTSDGMSIVWCASMFGVRLSERCNMTEAFRYFLKDTTFPSTRALLIGGTEEEAQKAANAINQVSKHVTVVDVLSGYLAEDYYRSYLASSASYDFVLLGLGTPRTELLASLISPLMPSAIVWHIGGGTILFLAQVQTEAPRWMRKTGLQWLHRLILEPKRMWKRYLKGNLLFLARCAYWRWLH